jgi:hypothetical protein
MNRSSILPSSLLTYQEASASQLAQAITHAAQVLAPYYPAFTWAQWLQAFEALELPLRVTGQHAITTAPGLSGLIQYFETQFLSASKTAAQPEIFPALAAEPDMRFQLEARREVKKTYAMRPDVLESLERVNYWLRKGKSALVNQALMELLVRYPESLIPIPPKEF